MATLVFCTIPNAPQALREVRRVLKGSGEFRLVEHVRVEQRPVAWVQEKATPLWKRIAGGCHLDRDTLDAVREAKFEVERVERRLDGLLLASSPAIPRKDPQKERRLLGDPRKGTLSGERESGRPNGEVGAACAGVGGRGGVRARLPALGGIPL